MKKMHRVIPLAAIDDGASRMKIAKISSDGNAVQLHQTHSLVSFRNSRQTLSDLSGARRTIITIDDLPALVGNSVLLEDRAALFDTSDSRYTSVQAEFRLAASLAWIVEPEGLKRDLPEVNAIIDVLVLGSNVKFYRRQGTDLKQYARAWNFQLRETPYHIDVRKVITVPQPYGAWLYVKSCYPEIDWRTVRWMIVDPGRFTTDVLCGVGEEIDNNRSFAIEIGVQAVADELLNRVADDPALKGLDLTPDQVEPILQGSPAVQVGSRKYSLKPHLQAATDTVWNDIANQIRTKLHGFNPAVRSAVSGGAYVFSDQIHKTWAGNGVKIPQRPVEAVVLGYIEQGMKLL